jgi:hypothetical protein
MVVVAAHCDSDLDNAMRKLHVGYVNLSVGWLVLSEACFAAAEHTAALAAGSTANIGRA